MQRYLYCLFVCLLCLPDAGAQPVTLESTRQVSFASPNFDAGYYHLTLDLRFTPAFYLTGRTRVQGTVVDQPMDVLTLDFASNDEAIGLVVDSVLAPDGTPLEYDHATDVLSIELPELAGIAETVAVDVFYRGVPRQGTGFDEVFGFGRLANGDPYAWTLSEPYGARVWWPCKDHPADKADSVRITVTVPNGMRVGSQGLLIDEIQNDDGTVTYDWFSRYPISTYLVSIAAGVYNTAEQTYVRPDSLAAEYGPVSFPVLHYFYAAQFENVPPNWALAPDMIAVFEYWFGPYPFAEEKYGHAQFTWGGGMEHQTMSSMGGANVSLVSHELAHMWFGDLVTTRYWPHLWLNEGFASYAELLYYQARPSMFGNQFQNALSSDLSLALNAPGTLVVQDTTNISNLFNGSRVYAKGSAVLHMLRGVVGDEAFREILRSYAYDERVRYGTAVTADFQRVAEEVSGLDLDAFFRQWVTEGTGYPVYEVSWSASEREQGFDVHVRIDQRQTESESNVEVFEMPITLLVRTESGDEHFRVMNDSRQQSYTFNVSARPTEIVFDPDRYLLKGGVTVVDVGDLPVVPQETEITKVYPNPARTTATIGFALSVAGDVTLDLFDALGRRVDVLFRGHLPEGAHETSVDLTRLSAGTYFVRLRAGDTVDTNALIVP